MASTPPVRWRPLLLPAEHGAWSFVLEPLVLGLLVAPSPAAPELALATLALFFARQPAKLALQDISRRQRYPRTVMAARLAIGLTTAAGLFALAAWRISPHPWWIPVAAAAPLALLQLAYDVRREGRGLVPELAGPAAASASAPAMVAAAGWDLAVWVTL
ncbi:MAG TPA: YwiC-like family protein, partial [Methylomirabilota bacterium]